MGHSRFILQILLCRQTGKPAKPTMNPKIIQRYDLTFYDSGIAKDDVNKELASKDDLDEWYQRIWDHINDLKESVNAMLIRLSKEQMEALFLQYLEVIFNHPEIMTAAVKDIVITRESVMEAGKQAFNAGFHDIYSDIDLTVKVRLSNNGSVKPEDYMKRIDRFGVSKDTALGWMFVPIHQMYRIILKNGMRYDFSFVFEYEGEGSFVLEPYVEEEDNENWPLNNIDRFWFIQVQALGKLYRKDYLISSHLSNLNCNDTLVMQMVLRDLKYGTSYHRFGHSEELEYIKDLGKNPLQTEDKIFDRISDQLYAAALSYDRLAKEFYPEYRNRSDDYFAIWDWYESYRR